MEDPGSDLSQLDKLTEESILEAVKKRYREDKIYSSVGEDILLAVNPYKELPIYDKENHEKYRSENFQTNLPPHVFRVAAQAYLRMRQIQSNQIILVCGESGAGKTESAKYMLQHFMQMCPDDAGDLHERIIRVNPLLESFGNAKTVMNDNSSRFAKFLQLSFGHDGQVIGASVRDYMLEKCRVVGRNEDCGEGNFHIFYGMFAGLSQQEKQDLFLLKPETYSILKGSIKSLKMTNQYENQYKDNMETLKKIGMTEADKKMMHCMLAAILHLSQIEFQETDKASGQLDIANTELVEQAASLLEVSSEAMGHALISSTTIMAGDEIKVYKSLDQATDGRDALAKHMYERLFGWIVKKINTNLHPNHSSKRTEAAEIGILDIAGFENLQTNSFEQMCINMVNERLQYFMNNVVLIQEKRIYESEEIPFENVDFKDNMNIIQMFEISKIGILPSLDEESKFQQGTDSKFVERLKKNFPKGHVYSPLLTFARGDRIGFGVKHFAGAVWYNCTNILEKNRDTLNKDIEDVMKSSNDDCIADLFSVRKGDTGTISSTQYTIRASRKVPDLGVSIRAKTDQGGLQGVDLARTLKEKYGKVGKPTELIYMPKDSKTNVSYFQKSISQLLSKLRHADSFFVRCIKPNRHMAPEQLDEKLVRGQLKYNGISAICLIRKNGYPSRILIEDFIKRYKPLFSFREPNNKDMVKTILDGTLPIEIRDKYRIGKNKVFMKESVNSHIDRVHFIRQKWAASVISGVLTKNCEVQKRERLKKEQKEKERKRKLEEERKCQKEEEERKRGTEDQQGKDIERTAWSSFKAAGFENPSNGSGSSYRRTTHDSDSDDTDKHESDDEPIETNRFKDLKGTKKFKEREKISSSTESFSGSGSCSYDPSHPPPRRGSVKKEQPGPPPRRERKFWDIFQTIARETKTQDVHTHTSLRIIKVLTYITLFLMLLACLVIQKISLATLITGFQPDRNGDPDTAESDTESAKESSARYMLTLIAVCTPYLLIFIVSVWRSLFGNIRFPSIFSIITCVVIEVLHSIGLCLLVFHLLPDLGAVQGIGLLSAVAIFPSLLKPLFSNDTDNDKEIHRVIRKIFCFVLDLLAFFVQVSAIPVLIVPYTQYIHGKDTNSVSDVRHIEIVKIAGALLLCSLSWWENFIDDKVSWCKMSRIKQAFFELKFDLQEGRPFISLFVSFFKVGTSVLFAYLLMKDPLTFDFKENFKVVGNYKDIKLYWDILALVLSGYVGYYLAYTVCKLQMQRLSFSIPCILSTPIAIIVLIFECDFGLDFVSTVSKNSLTTSCDYKIDLPWFHILLAALWLLSFYWVARHIWFPKQERLAKVERLFVNPLYCGILLEQHLVLNRRRHNRRVIFNQQKKTFELTKNDQKSGSTAKTDEMAKEIPPMIYACATMWHENRVEIVQLLKSLFRMDKDQFLRKTAYEMAGCKNMQEIEYYEFEAHILFDDAFELNDDEKMVPNSFVKLFASLMNEAASAVHSERIELPPPFIIPSNYGGQVIFTMPGGNFIYTHLKDKEKIRHRKRWSQVMYMYYLLGYRIVKECETYLLDELESTDETRMQTWDERLKKATGITGKSVIFQSFDEEVLFRAENTFLLALDGDVDFTPGAVRLLLDRMRKNPRVGAACGRIHPIGSGPMVWYQKFEYAVAHWLQKSTEHVLGCVLCSPGCFSLFRGSALMDDNVMHKYTTKPTEPSHHLMYDQGEDRWLCTLLLQQGYRVDYAAASDAFTYAPEGFDEYFNQRRRWTPSTIANILDLLQDGRNTVASNNNISWLYIVYQAALMVSTIIGPATVLMMIAGALLTVFSIDLITSYIISLIPAILFFIICFVFNTKIQLIVAQILSGIYVFIMMVVFVGALITAVTVTPYHPSVIFLSGLVLIFLIAAAFHPREFHNLIFGVLYFLWVPSGFLVLIIYSLCNLHVVSWGTREVPKKKTKAELEQEEKEKKAKEEQKKKESFWNKFFPFFNLVQDLKHTITEKMTSDKGHDKLTEVLIKMNENLEKINKNRDSVVELEDVVVDENKSKKEKKTVRFSNKNEEKELDEFDEETYVKQKADKNIMNDLVNPAWVKEEMFSGGELMQMIPEERDFWEGFVNTYLKPLDKNKEKEKKDTEKLMELRNNVCGGMALVNMLWVAINFMFQYKKPTVIDIPLSYGKEKEELDTQQAENVLKVDVVGLMFIIFFLFILLIQFFGMVVHRWGTFMHLIAITEIPSPFGKTVADVEMSGDSFKKEKGKIAVEFCEKLMAEPMPDYPSDESIEIDRKEIERHLARAQIKNNAETGTKDRAGQLNIGASLRNTIGRESTRESSSDQRRRSTHQMSFDNADILKKSVKYLEEAKLPKEDETTGVRYRKKGRGKMLLENESSGVRKIGSTAPAQRDFIERVRKNRGLAEKFNLNTYQRNLEAHSFGQSFSSGENVNMEEDDIYDELPATGTLDRMWAKKWRYFNQSLSATEQNRRNRTNQFLN